MELAEQLNYLQTENPILAETFKSHWDTPLKEYSRLLWEKGNSPGPDPVFLKHLKLQLRSGISNSSIVEEIISSFAKNPVLQTSHHITPTNGPGFLSLDMMALAGKPEKEWYLVGANSGVAFSNVAWSGALSFSNLSISQILKEGSPSYIKAEKAAAERREHGDSESRISLIPAKLRDALVFGNGIPDATLQIFNDLTPEAESLLAPFQKEDLFSKWAAANCGAIQKQILQNERMHYLDINQLAAGYLADILRNHPEHPVYRILFNQELVTRILETFENPAFFLSSRKGKKSWKVESNYCDGKSLIKSGSKEEYSPEQLAEQLENQALCPGIFLLFFILRFVNGIRCMGSYRQVEYLEDYRLKWQALNLPLTLDLEPERVLTLTAGRYFENGEKIYPLDLALTGRTLNLDEIASRKTGYFWKPVLNTLLQ